MAKIKTYRLFFFSFIVVLLIVAGCGKAVYVVADRANVYSDTGAKAEIDTVISVDTASFAKSDTIVEDVLDTVQIDTVSLFINDTVFIADTVFVADTISINDTIPMADTVSPVKKEPVITSKIDRTCNDSTIQDLRNNKVYYFGQAVIKYEDMTIEADYIEFDFVKHTVFAKGLPDSTGKIKGAPVFTEGNQKYEASEMTFNFDTKKGIINKVFTEDATGYLHGNKIKRMNNNTINIKSGSFTTCSLKEHPHFELHFAKAKVIPDDKIIIGPAYFRLEESPLPIGIPFGMFPNSRGRHSGIIVPSWGESSNRGYYLENGGYYWAINDNMDLQVLGDIYTRGSWALKPTFRYIKKYRYSGSFVGSYSINKVGTKGSSDYTESTDFKIRWIHQQDKKARPKSSFSANVYIVSSNYNKYNAISSTEYLSNTFQSSIAYQTSFADMFYLTVNGSHSQNTISKIMSITLPEISLSMNRIYPFKNIGKSTKKLWYKEVTLSYSSSARNSISIADSLLFKKNWTDKLQNGIQHQSSLSVPIKLLKYISWTTSANMVDRMYFSHIEQQWNMSENQVHTDTVRGFSNLFSFDFSSSFTTKIYGMLTFKKGPVRAIRHVITPSIGFSYTPDFSTKFWNYYGSYVDGDGIEQVYNMFSNGIYGSPPSARSGRINYSLGNNLEIKVPSKKDTVTGLKKIVLLESFSLSGSYDLAKDSIRWSYLSMSARTTLFKNLSVQYSSIWDPYALDSLGKQTNSFEWDVNHRLFRKNSATWNFSMNYTLNNDTFKKDDKKNAKTALEKIEEQDYDSELVSEDEITDIKNNPTDYVDWETKWSLSLGYNLMLSNSYTYLNYIRHDNRNKVQTLSVRGEVNLSPKWKVSAQTGWDFETKKLSYTSLTFYRDLHCWEMRFNWIPIGGYKSWNFIINVKASALQDLKLTKKKDYRDN